MWMEPMQRNDSLEEEYEADYEVDTSLGKQWPHFLRIQLHPWEKQVVKMRSTSTPCTTAPIEQSRKRSAPQTVASWLGAILSSSFTIYFFWALAVGFLGFIL